MITTQYIAPINGYLCKMNPQNTQLQQSLSFMVLASLMFALTGAIARLLKDEYASVHLVLFRNVIVVVFVLYWLYTQPPQQVGGRPWLLFCKIHAN